MQSNGYPDALLARLNTVVYLIALFGCGLLTAQAAVDPDRDFSGLWKLDQARTQLSAGSAMPFTLLQIEQDESLVRFNSQDPARPGKWTYSPTGKSTRFVLNGNSHSSATKWEGTALIVNNIVTGSSSYTRMERWKLARDRRTLMLQIQTIRGSSETEDNIVYERVGAAPDKPQTELIARPPEPAPKTAEAPAQPEILYVVPAGTQLPLRLGGTISAKTSNDGDRVYLTTEYPITINGRIIIPPGSAVSATVTEVTRPGKVKGRGGFFLRFDSITLPNGTTRTLRSRPSATDATQTGSLDRAEGQVKGEGNKSGDARTVGATTGAGAAIGSIGGAQGAGIGAAAGAAVGLGKILLSRGPGATLEKGSVVEMTLDRDLSFKEDEIR